MKITRGNIAEFAQANGCKVSNVNGTTIIENPVKEVSIIMWGNGQITRADVTLDLTSSLTVSDAARLLDLEVKGVVA